jgi:hypothetical protein
MIEGEEGERRDGGEGRRGAKKGTDEIEERDGKG